MRIRRARAWWLLTLWFLVLADVAAYVSYKRVFGIDLNLLELALYRDIRYSSNLVPWSQISNGALLTFAFIASAPVTIALAGWQVRRGNRQLEEVQEESRREQADWANWANERKWAREQFEFAMAQREHIKNKMLEKGWRPWLARRLMRVRVVDDGPETDTDEHAPPEPPQQ